MRWKLLLAFFAGYFILTWGRQTATAPWGDQQVRFEAAHKECFKETRFRYCIYQPAQVRPNGNLVYFLHGRNLDENIWNDDTFYTSMIQKHWSETKTTPPTVVTVSFGGTWLLTPKGSRDINGLIETMTDVLIPIVETKVGKPRTRIIAGESMGGTNSMVLGLRRPDLFQRIVSLCPAIYQVSPYPAWGELAEFLKRTGADPPTILGIILLGKRYFSDENEWKESAALHLIDKADPATAPEIYLSCGLYDKYGNYEGDELLAQKAISRGIKLTWRPLYGGHCAVDIVSAAEALAKP